MIFGRVPARIVKYDHCALIVLFILFFQLPFSITAQTDSTKLFRSGFNDCDELLKRGKYEKAITCLQSLSDSFPNQVKTYVRLAELFYNLRDNKNLLINAKMAMDINANEAYAPLTYLANKMMTTKDADLGLFIISRLATSDLDTIKQAKAEKNRMHHTLKSYADKTPVAGVHLRNMGDSINSKENEYLPSISLDGNTIVFTRNVGGNEDFFISNRDSNLVWSKAKNLGYPPNTGLPDGAAKLSADGNYLFYTRCDMRSPDGIRGGGCDIVFSYRENGGWSAPQMFGYTINTTAYEGQPCLSSDNQVMFFVSNREGGYGGMDIWMSKFEKNLWSKPENLGPNINTGKDETSPFIHPDNETLYFASNGHTGLGLSDLFISRKNINGSWKIPINLGAPINTDKFDGSIIVNAKGTLGYCTSDRADTKGGLDIYSFDLYPAIQPIPTLCLKGFVVDKFFKNHITKADISFINSYNKLSVGEEKSNSGNGSYTKALQMGKRYLIAINEKYYRPFYKYISLTDDTLSDNVYLNIKLKQPGLIDTLYSCSLLLDSSHTHFDSLSQNHIDTLLHHWNDYTEDSATVILFLKSYYYSGDSLADSTYKQNIETCFAQMQLVAKQLEKKKVACHVIMRDPCMLIYKDDELPYRKIELTLLEYY